MGNTQGTSESTITHNVSDQFSISKSNITFIVVKQDLLLGEVSIYKTNTTKQTILCKNVMLEDQSLLTEENLRKLTQRVDISHKNLVHNYGCIIDMSSKEVVKVSIFFEPAASDAAEEFSKRAKEQNFFEEEELTSTLVNCIEALQHLQSHSIHHGCICPSSILMSLEREIKLLDHSLVKEEHSAYFGCFDGLHNSYSAPEILELVRKGKPDAIDSINSYKADVFSLGMTFLYAALLEEPTDCYNWKDKTINYSKVLDRYDRVRDKYQGPFANLLQYLLKVNPKDRPDFSSLKANLPHYQENTWYERDVRFANGAQKQNLQDKQKKATAYSYFTPKKNSNNNEFPESEKFNFTNPEVLEIIREAKTKNWSKYSSTHNKSNPDRVLTEAAIKQHNNHLRYANAFEDDHNRIFNSKNYGSRLQRGYHSAIKENDGYGRHFDTSKRSFNSPTVNKIISEVYSSHYSSPDKPRVNKNVYENSSLYHNPINNQQHCLNYHGKKDWISGLTPNATKSPLAVKTTEETIRELREKYGSNSQQSTDQNTKVDLQVLVKLQLDLENS